MDPPPISRSRLEINFIRLLEETQQMANGNKPKDWTFEKWMEDRNLIILYGSQTGTAQEVAERIGREAYCHFFIPLVSSMDDFNIEEFSKATLVVFVAATTGQGDNPDNMTNFFKTLWANRKNRQLLVNLKFGVIGLGDSSYQKFNFAAKRLNNLLMLLGGQSLVKIGLGDDQHDLGPDFVVDSWLKLWWTKLLELYPLPDGIKPISSHILPPPKYKVCYVTDEDDKLGIDKPTIADEAAETSALNPFSACVTINKRVTAEDHFQEVRLVEFDVSKVKHSHKPGDVLMVQPQNLEEFVNEFISVLNLDPEKKFSLESSDTNIAVPPSWLLPRPCTIRDCVKNYFDIQSVPKRYFFELLSFFTTDENEKEKFLEFSSPEGQQDLYDYCNRPKRSIMEVLADFPHTTKNIPFEYLFNLIPPIRPRPYSIASSVLAIPGRVQLLVAVVEYRTILKRPRLGLCTNWLSRQKENSCVPVWFKSGALTFPSMSSPELPPVIMIGPGTGCAPFRAYIQERVASGYHENVVMVFGCRNCDKDYFFKEEWETLVAEKKLNLYCAFSRDQEDKVYVQHVMRQHAEGFWDLIGNKRALVFFAGNAKRVPIDVYDALKYICEKGLGCSSQDVEEYMKKDLEKRYQTETWA
ncbi:NADPH-dependent diflavin oxidoreductase 1 isoform X1 [Palaemon carinicauda]|uniref:NADPH-dependent diflavin oxidoreductase 1 isoform X1 n=1 Tax=Palaemon carinicauda TaxID=392227 RepID=UPI0035B5F2E0